MVREFKYRKYKYSTLEDAEPVRDYDRMQKYINRTINNHIYNLRMDPYEEYRVIFLENQMIFLLNYFSFLFTY